MEQNDKDWEIIEPYYPNYFHASAGSWRDNRKILDGMLCVLRTGAISNVP